MKVLYIGGWGRSGTTLVGRVLGQVEGVVWVGELANLWARGLNGWPCGCGELVEQCPFWTSVIARAFGDNARPDPLSLRALQRSVARTRHVPGFVRRYRRDPSVRTYADIMDSLYRAVTELTGAEVIVDSSKDPGDGLVVSVAESVELYVLHLVRDPRAVAYSWSRPTPYPGRPDHGMMRIRDPADSSLRWLAWNLAIEGPLRRSANGRYLRLRYEDVMSEPQASFSQMLELVGVPERPPLSDGRAVSLPLAHCIASNPGRSRTGTIPLELDDTWKRAMSWWARTRAVIPALPLMPHYGYRVAGFRSASETEVPSTDTR